MILTVVDRVRRFGDFVPTSLNVTGEDPLQLLFQHVFKNHWFPSKIVSDRDIRFNRDFYLEMAKRLKIQLAKSSSNHPQTNGLTERLNRTIGQPLKRYCAENPLSWDLELLILEFTYNNTPHVSINTSSFLVDLGYEPLRPSFVLEGRVNSRSDKAWESINKQKAVEVRTRDDMTQFQLTQELNANERTSHKEITSRLVMRYY